jgi:hypothetical protein
MQSDSARQVCFGEILSRSKHSQIFSGRDDFGKQVVDIVRAEVGSVETSQNFSTGAG